jgi:hypothetical protein
MACKNFRMMKIYEGKYTPSGQILPQPLQISLSCLFLSKKLSHYLDTHFPQGTLWKSKDSDPDIGMRLTFLSHRSFSLRHSAHEVGLRTGKVRKSLFSQQPRHTHGQASCAFSLLYLWEMFPCLGVTRNGCTVQAGKTESARLDQVTGSKGTFCWGNTVFPVWARCGLEET